MKQAKITITAATSAAVKEMAQAITAATGATFEPEKPFGIMVGGKKHGEYIEHYVSANGKISYCEAYENDELDHVHFFNEDDDLIAKIQVADGGTEKITAEQIAEISKALGIEAAKVTEPAPADAAGNIAKISVTGNKYVTCKGFSVNGDMFSSLKRGIEDWLENVICNDARAQLLIATRKQFLGIDGKPFLRWRYSADRVIVKFNDDSYSNFTSRVKGDYFPITVAPREEYIDPEYETQCQKIVTDWLAKNAAEYKKYQLRMKAKRRAKKYYEEIPDWNHNCNRVPKSQREAIRTYLEDLHEFDTDGSNDDADEQEYFDVTPAEDSDDDDELDSEYWIVELEAVINHNVYEACYSTSLTIDAKSATDEELVAALKAADHSATFATYEEAEAFIREGKAAAGEAFEGGRVTTKDGGIIKQVNATAPTLEEMSVKVTDILSEIDCAKSTGDNVTTRKLECELGKVHQNYYYSMVYFGVDITNEQFEFAYNRAIVLHNAKKEMARRNSEEYKAAVKAEAEYDAKKASAIIKANAGVDGIEYVEGVKKLLDTAILSGNCTDIVQYYEEMQRVIAKIPQATDTAEAVEQASADDTLLEIRGVIFTHSQYTWHDICDYLDKIESCDDGADQIIVHDSEELIEEFSDDCISYEFAIGFEGRLLTSTLNLIKAKIKSFENPYGGYTPHFAALKYEAEPVDEDCYDEEYEPETPTDSGDLPDYDEPEADSNSVIATLAGLLITTLTALYNVTTKTPEPATDSTPAEIEEQSAERVRYIVRLYGYDAAFPSDPFYSKGTYEFDTLSDAVKYAFNDRNARSYSEHFGGSDIDKDFTSGNTTGLMTVMSIARTGEIEAFVPESRQILEKLADADEETSAVELKISAAPARDNLTFTIHQPPLDIKSTGSSLDSETPATETTIFFPPRDNKTIAKDLSGAVLDLKVSADEIEELLAGGYTLGDSEHAAIAKALEHMKQARAELDKLKLINSAA